MKKFMYALVSSAVVLGSLSGVAHAQGTVAVTSSAFVEKVVKDAQGNETKSLQKAEKAIPGQEVVFKNELKNNSTQKANNLVLNNPVPQNMTLVEATSAQPADITYSVDGKTFAKDGQVMTVDAQTKAARVARKEEYTQIRWVLTTALEAGQTAELGFKAIVK